VSRLQQSIRVLYLASGLAAVFYVGYFVALSSLRIAYPFELEWMEGGTLEHVARVLRGEPLYPAPSIEFIPFPYPPFYYYVSAVFARGLGADFFALRLVSVLSVLGSAVVIYGFVVRETERRLPGLLAAGVFCATFRASGLYFDVARVDSLFLFLTLLTLYLLRFQRSPGGLLAAAFVATLAAMTKQTALVVLAPVGLWCLWLDLRAARSEAAFAWRRFEHVLYFGLPLLLGVALSSAWLDMGDQQFLRYVVSVQQEHELRPNMIGWFFGHDLMSPLPVACLFAVAYLLLLALGSRKADGFYLAMLAGIFAACLVPRVKVGGAANNLPPAHAALAILFGIAAAQIEAWAAAERSDSRSDEGDRGEGLALLALIVPVCWVIQLSVLAYTPKGFFPSAVDRAAGESLVRRIAEIDGEVLIPAQGYLAGMAGKRVYAHQRPAFDYAHSGLPEAAELERSYAQAIREQRFAAIIDSTSGFLRGYPSGGVLEARYDQVGHVLGAPDVLKPISGFRVQPGILWAPSPGRRASGPEPTGGRDGS